MVVCSVCKSLSAEGDFCEVCGSPLVADSIATNNDSSSNSFGGGVDKIKSGLGKDNVIYKVTNIPSTYEKNIVIGAGEVVFIDDGTGMQMVEASFNTTRNKFACYYVKKDVTINVNTEVPIEVCVKKIKKEKLNVKIKYDVSVSTTDTNSFFNSLIGIKDDTWKISDLEITISDLVVNTLNEKVKGYVDEDDGLNLKERKEQLENYNDKLQEVLKAEFDRYALSISKFEITSIDIDKMELNKLLVDNLYK